MQTKLVTHIKNDQRQGKGDEILTFHVIRNECLIARNCKPGAGFEECRSLHEIPDGH